MAAAGDDQAAVAAVLSLLNRLGFDAVDAGPLDAGVAFQPNGPIFGKAHRADELSSPLRADPSGA